MGGHLGCGRVEEVVCVGSSCFGLQVNSSVFSWPPPLSSSCRTLSAPTKPELLFGCQGAESWGVVIQDTALGGRTGFLARQCEEGGCEPPLSHSPSSLSKELSVVSKCHSDMPVRCSRPGLGLQSHPVIGGSQPTVPFRTPPLWIVKCAKAETVFFHSVVLSPQQALCQAPTGV